MRRFLAWAAIVAVAIGATACGDKGGSNSAVGVWTMDLEKLIGPMADVQVKAAMEKQKQEIEAAPADQREMMAKLMPDAAKFKELMLDQVRKRFAAMEMSFELKADHTATFSGKGMGDDETGTAKWEQSGDTITVTSLTKNGQPVEGKEATPKTAHMKDGQIVIDGEGDRPAIWLKRK